MQRKVIHSIGIDIGTTTTQVIFSNLIVVNRAPASQVPVYEFIDREISYQSPILFTPINRSGLIDTDELKTFIDLQIKTAGFGELGVETGAIIITGETAKAKNAREAIMGLSEQLGDFVVATAGPNLESVISGRGSGAQGYSEVNHSKVLNIDIGGGTSNYVVFDCGKVTETACLNVGGRLVELDDSGNVNYIHQPASLIIKELFGNDFLPTKLTQKHVLKISERMAELILEIVEGKASKLAMALLQTDQLSALADLDVIFLSGGVGDCYYQQQITSLPSYGDIGPLLAESLFKNIKSTPFNVKKPKQTLRATVIGAGAYSLTLSGSTIWVESTDLPLKNIPVVHPVVDWSLEEPEICQQIIVAAERMDLSLKEDQYAISFDREMPVLYKTVLFLAKELALYYQEYGNNSSTALIVLHNDIGKALGMILAPLLLTQTLNVIDEVATQEGDYLDIGKGYFGGDILPLTVKSLAFSS